MIGSIREIKSQDSKIEKMHANTINKKQTGYENTFTVSHITFKLEHTSAQRSIFLLSKIKSIVI
jgi:hypothetical protein